MTIPRDAPDQLSDQALLRAWEIAGGDETDAVEALERLLPPLVDAGYAEASMFTWRFTAEGVERAKSLRAE